MGINGAEFVVPKNSNYSKFYMDHMEGSYGGLKILPCPCWKDAGTERS